LIISRTPFRLSFFGGGTDLPSWYKENEGVVVSTTIDKYCYINARVLPSFFDHKHRIIYSQQERVNNSNEIQHPAVKQLFKFFEIDSLKHGIEIQHAGDLPARSGLGSSSSFIVGLLHAIYGLKGKMVSREQLYKDAIYIEQEMLKESAGSQDQVAAAVGGINVIRFFGDKIDVTPMFLTEKIRNDFSDRFMLFFTGFTRLAQEVEEDKIKSMEKKQKDYTELKNLAEEGILSIVKEDFNQIGMLLHESWKIKKSLSEKVSNDKINEIYKKARGAGALGGKLTGAGGGGFMLLFVNPWERKYVKAAMNGFLEVPFKFENDGSKIIYYNGDII
jgi:D-glycero-alpha-D-manno-heptose-7-phosphate kinase